MKKVYARIFWLCLGIGVALMSLLISVGGLAASTTISSEGKGNPMSGFHSASAKAIAPQAGVAVTMSTAVASPTNQSPFTVTAVFSEEVAGFIADDLVITNGVAGIFTPTFPSDVFSFAVTPEMDGLVTILIPAGAGLGAGSGQPTLPATLTLAYDGAPPGVRLSSGVLSGGEETALTTVPFTTTFSETVFGFGAADLIAVNGTITQFTAVASDTYTFDLTPQAPGPVTVTVPAGAAADPAGNENSASSPFTFTYTVDSPTVYLPLVASPYLVNGEIGFVAGPRTAGRTSFVPTATLDLSAINFPAGLPPQAFRVWVAGDVIPAWEPYSTAIISDQVDLIPDQYGAQTVNVQFRAGDVSSNILSLTLFYIPNGDFATGDLSGWQTDAATLPVAVQGGKLRLGDETFDCNNGVPLGVALAALDVNLLDDGDYVLHIMGTVFTEDQNPNNDATYDAFEIREGGALMQRYSNQEIPINCTRPIRTIDVDFQTSLAPYVEMIGLSLENWSRFDNFYNTYTDIDQVWVTEN